MDKRKNRRSNSVCQDDSLPLDKRETSLLAFSLLVSILLDSFIFGPRQNKIVSCDRKKNSVFLFLLFSFKILLLVILVQTYKLISCSPCQLNMITFSSRTFFLRRRWRRSFYPVVGCSVISWAFWACS